MMWNAQKITKDANGRTIHEPKTNCPSCGAFNVNGRCNCTVRKDDEKKTLNTTQLVEVVF